MYAIIKTGGKQYKVAEGATITAEKLDGDPESTVELTEVLMISDGDILRVGSPTVEGARVVATIVHQGRGRKVMFGRGVGELVHGHVDAAPGAVDETVDGGEPGGRLDDQRPDAC